MICKIGSTNPALAIATMSLLENFSALDELIQVLYEGASRFVLISHLTGVDSGTDVKWNIYLGLNEVGKGARWWMGWWTEEDVAKVAVSLGFWCAFWGDEGYVRCCFLFVWCVGCVGWCRARIRMRM